MPTLKGTEESLSYVQCFLYLVSSSINVSIFHITWLDTFWTDLVHQIAFYTNECIIKHNIPRLFFNFSIYFNCILFMNMSGRHLKKLYSDR